MTHASRIAAQLREFDDDDGLSPALRKRVADRLDELEVDDEPAEKAPLACPYCGATDDCRHRESAQDMYQRWLHASEPTEGDD